MCHRTGVLPGRVMQKSDGAGAVAQHQPMRGGRHRLEPHCPRCGAPTQPRLGGWIRVCAEDGSEHYPRTDPAVIMALTAFGVSNLSFALRSAASASARSATARLAMATA